MIDGVVDASLKAPEKSHACTAPYHAFSLLEGLQDPSRWFILESLRGPLFKKSDFTPSFSPQRCHRHSLCSTISLQLGGFLTLTVHVCSKHVLTTRLPNY